MTGCTPPNGDRRTILMWGRFDAGYSRNRVVRALMAASGFAVEEFYPAVSRLGDVEAELRGLKTPSFVWVPCFRLRDMAAAARWARRRGVPLVFDPLISAYQKQVFERRLFPAGSAAARRLLAKERALFALADVVVADTDCHRAFFHDTLEVPADRLTTLTVGASGEFAPAPLPVRAARAPREVLFYGSFIPLHGVETIVAAAKLTAGEPIHWTLLGEGPHKAACRRLAVGMDNVTFEDPIPFERLCDRIQAADVLLGVFGDTAQAARVMPNKFFQSLASGRPVVTRTSAAYPAAVAASPAVRFVPPSDPAALAAAVRDLCVTPGALDRAAADARALFDREFSLDVLAEQFRAVVRSVIPPAHPLVSVIVPVYNVEKYLPRCLDSVTGQTYGRLEIVCVNDGSTDASQSILADYAAKDARIKVLTQPNGGLSAARNAGLDAATGDYVLFVDSDDWIPPYAVEGYLKVVAESGARVVVSTSFAVDELAAARPDGFAWTLERPALAKLVGRRKIQSSACNKFFRRDVIGARRFIKGIYFEDWPFVTELFGDLDAFALVRAPMYVYCKNGASITRSSFNERKADSYLTGIRHVAAQFKGHPLRAYALRRLATAVKMLVGKTVKSGDRALRAKVFAAVGEQIQNGGIDRSDLDVKTCFRLGIWFKGLGGVWLTALGYWLAAGLLCLLVNPALRTDAMIRYAPMADAFARGEWFYAFHPRFGVIFQVVSGSLAFLLGIDGAHATPIAAFLFLSLAAVAVWSFVRRLWDERTAWIAFLFVLVSDAMFRYSLNGLRESVKCLGFALVALGVVSQRSRWFGLGLFVLITGFSYCFATASVLAFAWCVYSLLQGAGRKLPLAIGGWLAGTAAVTVMVHAYTGHWLPAPHFIKYLGGLL